ncbi:MAG: BolA family transcriptional regulator [Alphaproteobacteria bacterium]|nr:BolA family transcriptional regulator [Alphaproteobacteria bacterium]
MLDIKILEDLILDNIPDAKVHIKDLRDDGKIYAVHVVSPSFEGKSRIQQHQMIYAALENKINTELHAITIQTSVTD